MLIKDDKGYKKISIWHDSGEIFLKSKNKIDFEVVTGNCAWHQGIINTEVQFNPRHISNYAMICMKYTYHEVDKTNIIVNYGNNCIVDNCEILFNKQAIIGLNSEFTGAIQEYFLECPSENIPRGTIEIIGGAYDEVGSSYFTFKNVMSILTFIFMNYDSMDIELLGKKLMKMSFKEG